jgi:hypothetical protein
LLELVNQKRRLRLQRRRSNGPAFKTGTEN